MHKENGDDYIRRTATFIRTHEQGLANAAIVSRRRAATSPTSSTSLLGWIGLGSAEQPKRSIFFTDDPHHLFYLLMRFEALGIDVGSLDVHVENPSRPTSMSYLAMVALKDRSDALSITSFRSTMSTASVFSLGGSWFGRTEPPSLDADLKYLYSAFTKLPALRVRSSSINVIAELADNPPTDSAVPMDTFKNLQTLECCDIDPRILLGWDRLSLGLRSLTIKRSGLEDITDLLMDCVIDDDKLRREGSSAREARPKLVHHSTSARSLRPSIRSSQIPATVPENLEQGNESLLQLSSPERIIPPYAWSLLTHLSLADNNLTFLPSLPPLPSLLSLDISSNLLVSVPPSLSTLPSLKSLNLARNMVDSVLGIYSQIPSITSLNISSNRLDSLCGLERLEKLSRVDLRDNKVEDTDEIGRLAVLIEVKEVWVSGNPCILRDQDWRVHCFDLFAKENREIVLDGSSPGLLERRSMRYQVNKDINSHSRGSNGRPLSQVHAPKASPNGTTRHSPASSPRLTAVDQPPSKDPARGSPAPSITQNHSSNGGLAKHRRRKVKRIVDLDGKDSTDESGREALSVRPKHMRHRSDPDFLRQQTQAEQNVPGPSNPDPTGVSSQNIDKAISPVPGGLQSGMTADGIVAINRSMPIESPATISRTRQSIGASQTLSSAKAAKRRARISPSMYEPPSPHTEFPERGHERGPSEGGHPHSEADIFRMRMEALRNEVGDSWLKVFSQSHFGSPDGAPVRHKS